MEDEEERTIERGANTMTTATTTAIASTITTPLESTPLDVTIASSANYNITDFLLAAPTEPEINKFYFYEVSVFN